ncbi:12434_t:CDS:2 [Acaulospora colombiana]|uniref:12434_t:CDS:1 n=1 Tax=Acaulospora colombiana TaxID=27376 RepID=A0ACA9MN11_9GLOM|nr:12434_t:CDS:2 [Acaulospora colombiana]
MHPDDRKKKLLNEHTIVAAANPHHKEDSRMISRVLIDTEGI